MSKEDPKIAESIRSGTYFANARSWFQTVYIGPISERSFFLVVAVIAFLIAGSALIALVKLLPLGEYKPVILIHSDPQEQKQQKLVSFKGRQGNFNRAIAEFFVGQYVKSREGYAVSRFPGASKFIEVHSDPAAFEQYVANYSRDNPQSYAAMLGNAGQRVITIDSVRLGIVEGRKIAEVAFSADLLGVENPERTVWTARLEYTYTDLENRSVRNKETGERETLVIDPTFKVVNYVVEQK